MRVWIAAGLLILVILAFSNIGRLFSTECPAKTYGNSEKHVKYFSSPLCIACWMQKPIIEKISAEGKVTFEEYNADFCQSAAAPHYVRGVPSFLVNGKLIYGMQTEEQLRELTA
jgi:predicted DsbA family dithiol-disulfide isomerase